MAIYIKNPETEKLARELAHETGESIAEVIRKSFHERLLRVCGKRRARSLEQGVRDILLRLDAYQDRYKISAVPRKSE
jgi:antitoxin VapB